MRPHGISQCSFLVYLSGLHSWVTVAFWTSLPLVSLSAICAFVPASCSSGYDFAIPSSRLFLAVQTLGVALEFVGNYASVDFHHRALTCPSYQNRSEGDKPSGRFNIFRDDVFFLVQHGKLGDSKIPVSSRGLGHSCRRRRMKGVSEQEETGSIAKRSKRARRPCS